MRIDKLRDIFNMQGGISFPKILDSSKF